MTAGSVRTRVLSHGPGVAALRRNQFRHRPPRGIGAVPTGV